MRERFHGPHAIEPARANVLGVLSHIFFRIPPECVVEVGSQVEL